MDLGNAPATGTIALIVVTVLITATISTLIGVFGKRAAESLLEFILRPIRYIKEAIYTWIAPRNPFSISLRSYKRHIERSWLTKIENPIGPELDVPLEHAFAPLKLISSANEESIELFTHAATTYRCIVLGGPGTGKTTLMKSLITSVIKRRSHEELNDLIPVFVVLRKLAAKQHTVEQAIVAAFASFHFPGAEKFVKSALSQGKMLIILDGLDEVGVNREYVAEQILQFCESDEQQEQRNRLIVTCRENSYRTEDLRAAIQNTVRVEPFANHHMRVFLQGWPTYKGRSALHLYGLIQSDAQIRDICRNPLLLTILTGLYLDTDNFKLPTSRDRFYKAAIEELIDKRPARRQVKQNFHADDKRQVLERVSLLRLETVEVNEDPEEFSQEAIKEQAVKVLGEETDFREFIKELVEVNGIIKPSSDGIYTCAHRTIQEYFAGREARRTRLPEDVVSRFGNRPDLIQVLYFYCGLINNIPQLTYIAQRFADEGMWLEAGRCLLYMTEIPKQEIVERVVTQLYNHISESTEFKLVLEILSSLSQRPDPEFELARKRFSEAVDLLAGTSGATGASALETALATSPEAAMKVIPSLLKHESKRWQTAAVRLLKDIGTDEALDKLVQLLNDDNPSIREEAGKILAELIKSRNADMRERLALLPERKDAMIWPLENFFPGKLAIPVAESVVNSKETGNAAINCAARVVRARSEGKTGDKNGFLKRWHNVPRDLKLQRYKMVVGKGFVLFSFAASILIILLFVLLNIWGYTIGKVVLIDLRTLKSHRVDSELINRIKTIAASIESDVTQHYPPNASGLARIIPWNWEVEPVLPTDSVEAFNTVQRYKRMLYDPYVLWNDPEQIKALSNVVANEKLTNLEADINSLKKQLPDLSNESFLVIRSSLSIIFFPFGILLYLLMFRYLFVKVDSLKSSLLAMLHFNPFAQGKATLLSALFPSLFLIFTTFFALLVMNSTRSMILYYLVIAIGCIGAGIVLHSLHWPKNPLLTVVEDVAPSTVLKKEVVEEE